MWDCDSYKSACFDGINFDFLNEFWIDMKDDIMGFISEFH